MAKSAEFDAVLLHARIEFDPHPHLIGTCYGDKKARFADGDIIHTSRLTGHDGSIFFTKNSRYLVSLKG